MKFLLGLLVVWTTSAALSDEEQITHVSEMLIAIEEVIPGNARFHELKSATLNAVSEIQPADESSDDKTLVETEKAKRSPMQEVAAMTDMMLIQCVQETNALIKSHTKYEASCIKRKTEFSEIMVSKKQVEDTELSDAMLERRKWEKLLIEIPIRDQKMLKTAELINVELDNLAAAEDKRNKEIIAYQEVLADHDKALQDVKAIKTIVQNSALDARGNKNAKVSAGAKSAANTQITNLLEMKKTCHPRLHNLIELTHQSRHSLQSGSGVDRLYRLLYQTRDSLLASKAQAIKEEQSAHGAWRTNKIAFTNDINDLRILKATYDKEKGTIKRSIGNLKKLEGSHKITMSQAIKVKEDNIIKKAFLIVSCDEEQAIYSRELATKQNERRALEAVQKKLVSLKWSNKVYAAVASVSEGVTYFKGSYNIRSLLGRYVAISGTDIVCAPNKQTGDDASEFEIVLQKEDLTYHIKAVNAKKQTMYLTASDHTHVYFALSPEPKYSNWNFKFDKESNGFFIKNLKSRLYLNVDPRKSYLISTLSQTRDKRSLFGVERKEYREFGCFKNKIGKQLQFYGGAFGDMNTDKCLGICKAEMEKSKTNYKFFGLSEGRQCFCGNDFSKEKAKDAECGAICPGRAGEICGGQFRSLVYELTPGPKPIVSQE